MLRRMAQRHGATKSPATRRLFLAAGLLTWGVVGSTHAGDLLRAGPTSEALPWLAAFLVFGVAYFRNAAADDVGSVPLLALETLSALVVVATGRTGVDGALLAIVAAQAPELLSQRRAVLWVAAQSAALVGVYLCFHPLAGALIQGLIFFGFQGFTLASAIVMVREAQARRELARLHAQLQSTQMLLAAREREGERLRIARELHDSLGHHLTALSLNLEAAVYTAKDTPSAEHLRRAREAARTLLSEVRETVSALRDTPPPLRDSLRALVANTPGLTVHLDVPEDLEVASSEAAHSLIRCVQEVLTNTLRHARATQLWVRIESSEAGGVRVVTRDDGLGAEAPVPGAGLTGMRERFTRLGGDVAWRAEAGRGWELEAWLPATARGES
ncbi:sensor histidine kinase [Myxococcus sp. K15C18031901]|uniref:sensor histidine kinase n=1 Tax=Myxococcus dinghuensis TaxID=2906761 RepID=UPI0020A7B51D|nr:sensor histidine kinase [Myxococcus dinghuensis]MCP3098600.1 sensor histidine kinase [Myxococcus dinghuensis]